MKLLDQKDIKARLQAVEKKLKPFGIDCQCRSDLDYFRLCILSRGLDNKAKIEAAYEELSRDMFEIWQDLDYKKRNEFARINLAEMKDKLLCFYQDDTRIFIPFFDPLMNTLYDKETAVLQLPQFFRLYKDFKERMIDPFEYLWLPYQAGFVDDIQFLYHNEKGFGFYVPQNHSIYVFDVKKEMTVLPLSLSLRLDQIDQTRGSNWVEAALEKNEEAMVQWCINSGQIEEKVKKKCIRLLNKLKNKGGKG